ncbi:hypothetical protein [Lacimicrobium alkaliphilum]|nr:hypothetical protein [Lacimicrobium alkaliphilum]
MIVTLCNCKAMGVVPAPDLPPLYSEGNPVNTSLLPTHQRLN